ncbi:MAG: hypothetical protein NTX40_06190 [Planctomycetota bacterium]|nr:hypothetical protein [Planctomycetota bacterium]
MSPFCPWTQDQFSRLRLDGWDWQTGTLFCDVFNGSDATLRSLTFRVTFRRNDMVQARDVRSTFTPLGGGSGQAGSWQLEAGIEEEELINVELIGADFIH